MIAPPPPLQICSGCLPSCDAQATTSPRSPAHAPEQEQVMSNSLASGRTAR